MTTTWAVKNIALSEPVKPQPLDDAAEHIRIIYAAIAKTVGSARWFPLEAEEWTA